MYTECLNRNNLYGNINTYSIKASDGKPIVCLPTTKPFVYTISEPFIIASKAHFIVPISQTYVDVQCNYFLNKGQFSLVTHRGNMARSCKLLSNIEFLRKGSIIIRENENILGELMLPYDI
ncbi:unnamed protein product, partial [Didymodactylos carnosus]